MNHVDPETIINRMTAEQARTKLIRLTNATLEAVRAINGLDFTEPTAHDEALFKVYDTLIHAMDLRAYLTDEDRKGVFG